MAGLIEKYKATQKRIRRYFNKYTPEICPECQESCCVKPTRVQEFDVLLANACGYSISSANDSITEMIDRGMEILSGGDACESNGEYCEYLDKSGCIFPEELRPFECTRYICPDLKRKLTPGEMRELRALLHKLGVIRRGLLDASKSRR